MCVGHCQVDNKLEMFEAQQRQKLYLIAQHFLSPLISLESYMSRCPDPCSYISPGFLATGDLYPIRRELCSPLIIIFPSCYVVLARSIVSIYFLATFLLLLILALGYSTKNRLNPGPF